MAKQQNSSLTIDYYGPITKELARVQAHTQKIVWETKGKTVFIIEKNFQFIVYQE